MWADFSKSDKFAPEDQETFTLSNPLPHRDSAHEHDQDWHNRSTGRKFFCRPPGRGRSYLRGYGKHFLQEQRGDFSELRYFHGCRIARVQKLNVECPAAVHVCDLQWDEHWLTYGPRTHCHHHIPYSAEVQNTQTISFSCLKVFIKYSRLQYGAFLLSQSTENSTDQQPL